MSAVISTDEIEEAHIRNPYEIDGPEAVKVHKLRLGDNLPDIRTLTIDQRGESRAVGDQMAATYKRRVGYFKKRLLSLQETDPYRERFTPDKIDAMAREGSIDSVLAGGADDTTWSDLQAAMEHNPDGAAILWRTLKGMARENLACGEYASHAVMANQTPFRRATFSVMREAFISAWQPRNAIEQSLVETLVQSHIAYNSWLGAATAATEHSGYAAEAIDSKARQHESWNPPRLTSQETIESAMIMADRFNRLFLRTLRQLRDLRRYSIPVMINNPEQVNIAADGGQQVNVNVKGKKRKKA
jgi:hypothetical protein